MKVDLSYEEGSRNPQVESIPYLAFVDFCSISKNIESGGPVRESFDILSFFLLTFF